MEVKMRSKDERWALFWCELLHPVIFEEIEQAELNRYLKSLCETEYLFPDGSRKKPTLSTLRQKLNQYRQGGFNSLARKIRNDRGEVRSVPKEIIDKAVELKKEQPLRSDDTINRFLKVYYDKTIPKSTLYRHLKLAGATKIKLGITRKKVRKRWSRDHTHELWVGDFEDGPYVLFGDEVLPTYLCLFIDCHSRYVVEGRYYLRHTLDILIDSLLRAWAVHGASKELYVDNAKVYHANALKAACYSLGIKLLHRATGDPAPGGLVERIFGTCQSQFEAEVRAGDILPLEELNRTFSAYLEIAYHQRIHSETHQTPKERYHTGLTVIRHVDMEEVIHFFMRQDKRSVDKDFSDIRLNNSFYRVDPRLRGDKVQVRYDPFSDREKVWIYSLHDEYLGQGSLYHRDQGAEPERVWQKTKPKNNYLELLKQEHDKQLQAQSKGIDYRKVISQRAWPFAAFVQKLTKLMGRKGGLGAFNGQEYEILKKAYNRMAELNETILVEAWEKATQKTIPHLLYQLQIIKDRKENR
jgi:putative transposase